MNAVLQSKVSAAVLCMVCLSVRATNYTCDVPEGQTKSVSDFGYTFKDGDKLIKTGKGVLKAVNNTSVFYHIDISNGVYHLDSATKQKGGDGATLWVRKGATLDITWTSTQLFMGDWNVYMAGDGVGTGDYLGAICVGGTANTMNAIFGTGSKFYLSEAATVYTYGTMNPLFSGSGSDSGPTVFMNSYPLTLRGKNENAVFRPRHKLIIDKPGPIVVRNGQFTRHKTTLTCTANIPRITVTEGGCLQGFTDGDSTIWNKVDAFVFDYGTKIIKGGNGEAANPMTLANVTGPVEISSDEKVTLKGTYTSRGADLAAGHVITSGTTLTFASGCKVKIDDIYATAWTKGTPVTIATAMSIAGDPTIDPSQADLFTLTKTATELKVTPTFDVVTLAGWGVKPGEENAAANAAAVAANIGSLGDDVQLLCAEAGDFYFGDALDFSLLTAKGVTLKKLETLTGDVAIHSTIKVGGAVNFTVEGFTVKGVDGPVVIANGTQGLVLKNLKADAVVGTYGEGEAAKKYPFVMDGVTDFEVTGFSSVNNGTNKWDDQALFSGEGSQTDASEVRAGEIVAVLLRGKLKDNWYSLSDVKSALNIADAAWKGKKFVITGDGAVLDITGTLDGYGVQGFVIKRGQYVARNNASLGVDKAPVEVRDGGALTLAGKSDSMKGRTVSFEGTGLGGTTPAIRFTGEAVWNKTESIVYEMTGDAEMYNNCTGENGIFLYATIKANGHKLTLKGLANSNYRFGRDARWSGGGEVVVGSGVTVSASGKGDVGYVIQDDKGAPKFTFEGTSKFLPDSTDILNLIKNVDFANGASIGLKSGVSGFALTFDSLAGTPTVADAFKSLTVKKNLTVHAAQLKAGQSLSVKCPLTFASGSTVTLDDLSGYSKPVRTLIATAEGGITGKPKPDAALKAANWGVVKEGNSLYLDARQGAAIIIR